MDEATTTEKPQPTIGKILIVEDEMALSNALSLKLKSEHFDILQAGNGIQALELITTNKFDAILLDLMLPDMDGFDVLAKLQPQKGVPPVIVISNLSQDEDINKAKSLGATEFLVKSNIQLSQIVDYLKKLLKK